MRNGESSFEQLNNACESLHESKLQIELLGIVVRTKMVAQISLNLKYPTIFNRVVELSQGLMVICSSKFVDEI